MAKKEGKFFSLDELLEKRLESSTEEDHSLFKNLIKETDKLDTLLNFICDKNSYCVCEKEVTTYQFSIQKFISWIKKKVHSQGKDSNSLEKIKKTLELLSEYLSKDLYDMILSEFSISESDLIKPLAQKRQPENPIPFKNSNFAKKVKSTDLKDSTKLNPNMGLGKYFSSMKK